MPCPRAAALAATTHDELRAVYLDAIGLECFDVDELDAGCSLEAARAAVLAALSDD